ncbi:MAG: OadG family protein [Desulfomonile tiedjei]|nr:OadG family protein [Desulfomonile tiedjei]
MDKWVFGISVTVVGMGGTLLTLWFLSLCIMLLKKAFPPVPESPSAGNSQGGGAK